MTHKLYTNFSSLSESHQQSVKCWEIIGRTSSKEEEWFGWWRTRSARLHLRRTVWEKQVGRIQRHLEEGEGREVRKQIDALFILNKIQASCCWVNYLTIKVKERLRTNQQKVWKVKRREERSRSNLKLGDFKD